ncbi:hypothetical protein GQ55_1G137800 [Panicum hallii var. hallii]|uniref:AB hydrolase-1 domain-containing protein n=1 Tax=Panicum hallii var. hallii TaxID=1504633 RepID=A0A2T7F563_9POAL|nr:hypothetical protein GQ55_1G137800 [Panicum hallii var. hallii]
MPYCVVTAAAAAVAGGAHAQEEEVRIFYQRYGQGATKVLLIIGFAGTYESWGPQVKGLTGAIEPVDEEAPAGDDSGAAEGVEVCCFDNRGMGHSSVPEQKSQYTTAIMAKDALALMDHLGWRKAHVFGHSMGSMIASKLAAMAPDRVASLALLNTTGGGYQCIPKCAVAFCNSFSGFWTAYYRVEKINRNMVDWHTISLACRFLRARTPEQRAILDLEVHYTKEYLEEAVGSSTRRQMLYQEYLKGLSSGGMQSRHGFEGQLNACWTHKLSTKELDRIRLAGFFVLIIHGRDDVIAQLYYARRLAEKLQPAAKLVELHGGHLVSHERPAEVNMSLMEMIKASKSNTDLEEWSNLPKKSDAGSLRKRDGDGVNYLIVTYNLLGKLHLILLFLFGVFHVILEHARTALRVLKPARVSASTL